MRIAAPFSGLFAAGRAFYFVSQGTGHMFAPVMVGVIRLMVVVIIGAAAAVLSWDVNAVFAVVAAGLSVVGVGLALALALCMRGVPWHGRAK